jgi:hypothetical protein
MKCKPQRKREIIIKKTRKKQRNSKREGAIKRYKKRREIESDRQ